MPDTNDFGDTAIAADEPESFGDTPLHGFGDTPVFELKRPTPETFGQVGAGIPEIPLGNAEGSIPSLNADVASGEGPGAFETLMSPVVELPPIPPEAMLGPAAILFPKGAVREAAAGAGRFVSKTASSLTSPGMMLLGGLGAVAPPAAAAIIAVMGAHSIGPAAVEAIEASKRGDVAGFTESALDAAMAGTMASGGARATFSALKPSPPIKELHSIADNARANGASETAKAFEETISGNGVIKPRLSNKPPVIPDQVAPVDLVPEPAPPISIKANAQMLDVLEPAPGAVGTVEADQALAAESDNSIILRTQDPAARANAFAARDAAIQRVSQREPAPAQDETPASTPPEPTPTTEPVAPPPTAPVIAVPPAPQKPEESGVGRIPVEYVPLGKLSLSADVPQFKAGANEKGVVRPLGGKFYPTGVGPIQVWRRLNGDLEVITGRHRFDLAQRSGETEILSQVHNEADGFTAADAAKLDAVLNILDGQGTVGDYARFFKYSDFTQETAKSEGLLADAKGKAGFAIGSGASDDLFALHQAEKLGDAQAAAIASTAPNNPALQAVGIRMALDGRSAEAVGDVMRLAAQKKDLKKSAADQGVLFDFDDSAIREMEAQSALASKERSAIRAQINTVKGAARKPELAKSMGVDVSNPAGILKKVQELEARLFLLKDHPELAGQLPQAEAPAPAVTPKLKPGGTGEAELFQGADAPFNLAGETTTDGARLEAEQAKAKADAAEAKRIADEQQPGLIGMGGAVSSEFGGTGGSPTAMKYKLIDQERAQRGLPPLLKPEGVTDQAAMDRAMAKIDAEPDYPDVLVNDILANPHSIETWQRLVLLLKKIDLRNELHRAQREAAQAYDDGRLEDLAAIKPRIQIWSQKLEPVEEASRLSGSIAGASLRALRIMANEDFSLSKMEFEKRADVGGRPLTDAERSDLVKKSDALEASNKAFEARVAELEKQASDAEAAKVIDEAKRAAAAQPTYSRPVLEAAERIIQGWEKRADAARARLKEKLWLTGTNPDPTIIIDLAEIGVAHIGRGLVDFAKWSDAMVSEFGEKIKPLLKDVWDASQKLSNIETDKLKEPLRESVKRKIKPVDVAAKVTDAKEKIGLKLQQGDTEAVTPNVNALVRALVEQDPNISRDALVDTVHDILKDFLPDLTRQEAADAISGRGKFWTPPQDEVSKTVRDLKTQIRLVEHQADVLARKPLPRTGYQPEPLSDAARQEQAKLNELKRKYGVVVTDPASQLASTLAARKTYYRHRISDLEQEIRTRERIVKTKSPSPTDAELESLKAEYKLLQLEEEEVFGKREMTPEQRAAAALKAVESSITELERQIQTGDIGPKSRTSKTPNTLELEAARARRDALLAQRDELRDLDPALNEAKAAKAKASQIAALEKEIAAVKEQITKGDLAAKQTNPRQNRPAQPEIEQAKQRLEVLREQLLEARAAARKADPVRLAEAERKSIEAQKKTLEKQIAEREGMITSGNLSPGQRMNRPLSPVEEARKQRIEAELAPLKQKLEQTNAILEQARKDARPVKSPEELALAALKTRLTRSNADLKDRLARGDFSPRPKPPPIDISKDPEAMRLKAENEAIKNQFLQERARDAYNRMTTGQKAWANFKEVFNLRRNFMTAYDLSAVGKQGLLVSAGNPARAVRNVGGMLKALTSEKRALAIEQSILHRPNAPLYARSKLFLQSLSEARLSAQEEATMSRLANKIPGLRASNRAYVTYLNLIRADTFDAMLDNLPLKERGSATQFEMDVLARGINDFTGRGYLGKVGERSGELLSTFFFAPRYIVSRLRVAAGVPVYGGTARTRLAFAKEYAKTLTGLGVMYGLAELGGATVENDPNSSDFGKFKWGHSRLDPLAGLAQVTTFVSRITTGETKKLRTGKTVPIRGPRVPYGGQTVPGEMGRFLRTKIAPVLGDVVDVLSGENVVGEKVTLGSKLLELPIPLAYEDIYQVMKDDGVPAGIALELLNVFGVSLQHFDETKRRPKN